MKTFIGIVLSLGFSTLTMIGVFVYQSAQIDWNAFLPIDEVAWCGTVDTDYAIETFVPAEFAVGVSLFKTNCASCHRITGQLVGPQLQGVAAKYADDKDWLYSWVRNSSKLIKNKDPKAIALFEQYGKQQMISFPTLTDEDIDAILGYADAMP